MKACSVCGKPARHFFSQTINGKNTTLHLCDACLSEGVKLRFEHSPKADKKSNVICPTCKMPLNEFKQTGYLGCPDCYTAFHSEIEAVLPQIQIGQQHKECRREENNLTPEQKIERLKAEMERAVKAQDFERAKVCFDEIGRLGGRV